MPFKCYRRLGQRKQNVNYRNDLEEFQRLDLCLKDQARYNESRFSITWALEVIWEQIGCYWVVFQEIIFQNQNSPAERDANCFPFNLVNIWSHSNLSYDVCFTTFRGKSTVDNYIQKIGVLIGTTK